MVSGKDGSTGNNGSTMGDARRTATESHITRVRVHTELSVVDAVAAYSCFALTPDVTQHFVTQGPCWHNIMHIINVFMLGSVWYRVVDPRHTRARQNVG